MNNVLRLEPTEVPFGSKSIKKWLIQSDCSWFNKNFEVYFCVYEWIKLNLICMYNYWWWTLNCSKAFRSTLRKLLKEIFIFALFIQFFNPRRCTRGPPANPGLPEHLPPPGATPLRGLGRAGCGAIGAGAQCVCVCALPEAEPGQGAGLQRQEVRHVSAGHFLSISQKVFNEIFQFLSVLSPCCEGK